MNLFLWWLVVGILFLFAELVSPGLFFFVSFFLGSVAASGVAFKGGLFVAQALTFLAASLIAFLAMSYWMKGKNKFSQSHYHSNVFALIGKSVVVVEAIGHLKSGAVKSDGDIWPARALHHEEFKVGQYVEVVKVVGNHLIVKMAQQQK
jgi:membrane protein implicated in regulation of membrane protease activity